MDTYSPRRLAESAARRETCQTSAEPRAESEPPALSRHLDLEYEGGDFGATGCCIEVGRYLKEVLADSDVAMVRLRWRHPNRPASEAIMKGLA